MVVSIHAIKIQLIKQQMPEEYVVHAETPMQFDNSEAALELTVDKGEAQGKGWMITLVSKKVLPTALCLAYYDIVRLL